MTDRPGRPSLAARSGTHSTQSACGSSRARAEEIGRHAIRKTLFLVAFLALMVTFLTIAAATPPVSSQASADAPCQAVITGSAALAIASATAQASTEYHGNTRSKIFHGSSCRHYNCGHCTTIFKTRQEAIDAGYGPCKVCKP